MISLLQFMVKIWRWLDVDHWGLTLWKCKLRKLHPLRFYVVTFKFSISLLFLLCATLAFFFHSFILSAQPTEWIIDFSVPPRYSSRTKSASTEKWLKFLNNNESDVVMDFFLSFIISFPCARFDVFLKFCLNAQKLHPSHYLIAFLLLSHAQILIFNCTAFASLLVCECERKKEKHFIISGRSPGATSKENFEKKNTSGQVKKESKRKTSKRLRWNWQVNQWMNENCFQTEVLVSLLAVC